MSADFQPSKEEMDAANADLKRRFDEFVQNLPKPAVGAYRNKEIKCPALITAFDEDSVPDDIINL